jgi:hypothetical protein
VQLSECRSSVVCDSECSCPNVGAQLFVSEGSCLNVGAQLFVLGSAVV